MENYKLISCVLLMGYFVSGNSLQCYECVDCPDGTLKDEWLSTCGEQSTTVAPTTTVTTAAPVGPTAATTAAPIDPTVVTTAAPVGPTQATSASPIDPTQVTTAAPVVPTAATTPAPIDPTVVTTAAPVGPTQATSAPPIDPTQATSAATVGPSQATSASPINPSQATSTAPLEPTAAPQATRVRRNVQPEIVNLDSGCRCNHFNCICDEETEENRVLEYASNSTEYVCAKATIKNETGSEMVVRGCAPVMYEEKEFCVYLNAAINTTACKTCNTDKCNDGISLQHSFAVLMIVLALALFIK